MFYYILNLQGDVVKIIAENGMVMADYSYNAWGEVLSVTNASGAAITASGHLANLNPIRYRGYYYDVETGFYYLQSRYYDPVMHRFINADSYQSTGQGFVGTNTFVYCLNNPTMRIDSAGMASWHNWAIVKNERYAYDIDTPSPKSVEMQGKTNEILRKEEYSKAAWDKLNSKDKKKLLNSLLGELSLIMDVECPGISYIDDYPGYDGSFSAFYDDENNDICFMPVVTEKMPYSMVTTLVHELYHAYQYAAVRDSNNLGEPYALILSWKANQQPGNYVDCGENLMGYYNQSVEVSAFWFSNDINKGAYIGKWGGYYGIR